MLSENSSLAPDEIKEIYKELDLHEEGITEEEIIRRKTRIFVGGLKFASEDHVLHDYFANFGKIKEAVVIRDRKTGLSKGYGFVTMFENLSALKAIAEKSPKLDGRRCNVNLAYIGQKKKPVSRRCYTKMKDFDHLSPQVGGYPNGLPVSPPIMMADGQYYQIGLPSLPGHIYQFPPDVTPIYDAQDVFHGQSQMTMMYQNPVVLNHPIVFDNPINPVNNSNNIYLTNNIFYQTLDALDGRTEFKDKKTKLSISGKTEISPKVLPQFKFPLPKLQMQPNVVPFIASETFQAAHVDSFNYGVDSDMHHVVIDKNSLACSSSQSEAFKANRQINDNSMAVINSSSYVDNNVHVMEGMTNNITANTVHVIVGAAHLINNDGHITKFASPSMPSSLNENISKDYVCKYQLK